MMSPIIEGSHEDNHAVSSINSRKRDSVTPEELSKLLHIGLATAKRTIEATTHHCIRTTGLLTRRFKTDTDIPSSDVLIECRCILKHVTLLVDE